MTPSALIQQDFRGNHNLQGSQELFSEKLKAFTLELPDFKGKSTEYPKSPIEYWLYDLINMETMTTALPFQTQQPIFGKVGGIAELVHMSEEERLKYNISLDTYRTNLSVMKNERAEGRQEGLAEGLAKGRKEGLVEGHRKGIIEGHKKGIIEGQRKGASEANIATAIKTKEDGMPTGIIQKYTGLTAEEIEDLPI